MTYVRDCAEKNSQAMIRSTAIEDFLILSFYPYIVRNCKAHEVNMFCLLDLNANSIQECIVPLSILICPFSEGATTKNCLSIERNESCEGKGVL